MLQVECSQFTKQRTKQKTSVNLPNTHQVCVDRFLSYENGEAEPRTLSAGLASLLTGPCGVYIILVHYRMSEAVRSDIHSLRCVPILNVFDIFLALKD